MVFPLALLFFLFAVAFGLADWLTKHYAEDHGILFVGPLVLLLCFHAGGYAALTAALLWTAYRSLLVPLENSRTAAILCHFGLLPPMVIWSSIFGRSILDTFVIFAVYAFLASLLGRQAGLRGAVFGLAFASGILRNVFWMGGSMT